MNIFLGNLSVKQIETRLGITLTEKEKTELENNYCRSANNIPPGKWHCFDIPFMILCSDKETAVKVRDLLAPYSNQMEEPIKIGIV